MNFSALVTFMVVLFSVIIMEICNWMFAYVGFVCTFSASTFRWQWMSGLSA